MGIRFGEEKSDAISFSFSFTRDPSFPVSLLFYVIVFQAMRPFRRLEVVTNCELNDFFSFPLPPGPSVPPGDERESLPSPSASSPCEFEDVRRYRNALPIFRNEPGSSPYASSPFFPRPSFSLVAPAFFLSLFSS